jgi:putative secretion ATPase (PEP-CTERM system associated)
MPFQLTPDCRFYFSSNEHKKAMAFLQYGLEQQEGFVVVTGEIGAGKTTLIEQLLATIDPAKYVTARVVTTQLSGYDTLCVIANAFGIPVEGMDKGPLLNRIRDVLAGLQSQEKHPVIIVDEAQSLTLEAIEELRMLSNLSAGPRAPFQGVFLGQPEFRTALSRPELQQLRQRVIASCHLGALRADDTRRYIEHRLTRAGWINDPSFSDDAFVEVHHHSGGVPRRINSLCSRLLLLGFLEERHAIDAAAVANVAREMAAELSAPSITQQSPPAVRPQVQSDFATQHPSDRLDDIRTRLTKVERTSERHAEALVRVLDLALKHLPE